MSETTLDQLKANAGLITSAIAQIEERDSQIAELRAEIEEHIHARCDYRDYVRRLRVRLERIETIAADKGRDGDGETRADERTALTDCADVMEATAGQLVAGAFIRSDELQAICAQLTECAKAAREAAAS